MLDSRHGAEERRVSRVSCDEGTARVVREDRQEGREGRRDEDGVEHDARAAGRARAEGSPRALVEEAEELAALRVALRVLPTIPYNPGASGGSYRESVAWFSGGLLAASCSELSMSLDFQSPVRSQTWSCARRSSQDARDERDEGLGRMTSSPTVQRGASVGPAWLQRGSSTGA